MSSSSCTSEIAAWLPQDMRAAYVLGAISGCPNCTGGVCSADKSGPRRANDRAHGHRGKDPQ